jgi:multicomponent Na+:H+ antiporter subunit D
MNAIPVLIPALLLTGAVLALLAEQWRPALSRAVAIVATGATAVLAIIGLVATADAAPLRHDVGGWPPPLGIELVLDPLAGFVAAIIGLIGLLVVLYPPEAGFATPVRRGTPLYSLTLLLLTGLAGVVLTGDLFNLFVFLEIYAIASYALVALGGPRAVFASLRYLFLGTIGSGLYLLGVGFLYFLTGTLNMADLSERLPAVSDSRTAVAALVLIVVGLAVKMALFPFHVWLPDAHTAAPPAVAALLAAVQVKVAAAALVRILFEVFDVGFVAEELPVALLLTWFGAAGVLVGSAMAIAQTDIKRMLAYSTVAQLGYIGIGVGLATPLALVGALLHVAAHAAMKSCLFLAAGGIYHHTGIRDVRRYVGLHRRMPWTAAALAIAALSMVGVPPTGGFFSKWYLLLGAFEEGRVLLAVVIGVGSLLTLWYVARLLEVVYARGGDPDPALAAVGEPGRAVLGPVLVLAGGVLALGLGNIVLVNGFLEPLAHRLLG